MIYMKQPAFAVNSPDVPGPDYSMWDTLAAPWGLNAPMLAHVIQNSVTKAMGSWGVPLRNVIINCHGTSGSLSVGGRGSRITIANVSALSALRTYSLGTLWCVACFPALGAVGQAFCSALAQTCGCRVVASEDAQRITKSDGYSLKVARMRNQLLENVSYAGAIDEYEGKVWQFDSKGNMAPCVPHTLWDAVLQ
jgi:hypothetical protein